MITDKDINDYIDIEENHSPNSYMLKIYKDMKSTRFKLEIAREALHLITQDDRDWSVTVAKEALEKIK